MSVSRRAVLAAAPAAMAAAVAPASTASAATDPHPAWLVRWRDLAEAINAHPTGDGPEFDLFCKEIRAIEGQISSTRAQTPAGILAQAEWLAEDGDEYLACEDHRAVVASVIGALREVMA